MKLHQSKLVVIYHGLCVWLTGMAWYSNCLPRVFPLLFRKIIFTFTRHDRHSKFSRQFFYILEQERKYKMLRKTNSEISSVRNFLSEVNMLKVKVYFLECTGFIEIVKNIYIEILNKCTLHITYKYEKWYMKRN